MRFGITGASGLLGWHLRCLLRTRPHLSFSAADRATFSSEESLDQFIRSCNVLVHFAGMNRGVDQELYENNVGLAKLLVNSLNRTKATPQLVFSSSTHIERDTHYGRSKRDSAEAFQKWADNCGAKFLNLVLPHVFGEGGRPFYNSVTSTFCHQLAVGEKPSVQNNGDLELLHAGTVAGIVVDAAGKTSETSVVPGEKTTVIKLLAHLTEIKNRYENSGLPSLSTSFERQLFNTYRSYLPLSFKFAPARSEIRNWLSDVASCIDGRTQSIVINAGESAGDYFRRREFERFYVADGVGKFEFRKLFSEEIESFEIGANNSLIFDLPELWTHRVTNTGSRPLTLLRIRSDKSGDDVHPEKLS